MSSFHLQRLASLALLPAALLGACERVPTGVTPPPGEPPGEPPRPIGVYQFAITGIGSPQMSSSVTLVRPETDASLALNPVGSGLVLEAVGGTSLVEGSRTAGGQRYVSFTYRLRNATGVPRSNITFILASRSTTIAGTSISQLRRFDGTAADPAIAQFVVPSGAVSMGRDVTEMVPLYADVLQVFTEAEIAAITLPSGVTGLFPFGYVVRSATSTTTRTLPAAASANQFDGVITVSFRLPLQSTSAQDVFSIFFEALAVEDTEVRVTETIEEQTAAGQAQVAAAAAALGATTVTVLDGSTSGGYPGQRQICGGRVTGTAASPATRMTSPGAYTRLAIYQPGESLDACAASFRTGMAVRVGVRVSTPLTVRAMDRYGNTLTTPVDTVALTSTDGGMTTDAAAALTAGMATLSASFSGYGAPVVTAAGRRVRGTRTVPVVPISRTWTGASIFWSSGGNWGVGSPPFTQDTAVIPSGTPNQPILSAATAIGVLNVADGVTVELGSFDMTVAGSASTGQTGGGVTGGTGRLILSGAAGSTVAGRLPEVRVTGIYTLSNNLLLKTPAEVDQGGGLESVGWLTEIRHY